MPPSPTAAPLTAATSGNGKAIISRMIVAASASVALRTSGPMTLHRLLSKRLLKALALAEAFGLLPSPVEEDEEAFGTNTIVDEPDPVGQSAGGKDKYDDEAQAERERQEKEAEAGKKGNEALQAFG